MKKIRALAALTLLAAAACRDRGQPPARIRPALDIVLITIDTLRADALGFSGNARVRTPHLDRLAKGGLVFSNAHAHNVVTLPSHVNILTGLYPYRHGVRDNEGFRLDPRFPTLATLLRQRGYATAASIGAFPLDARFGLAKDFDLYDEAYPQGANAYDFLVPERPAAEVVATARSWYQKNAGRPRFLWVHVYDCHAPHIPPPALQGEFVDAPYLGEVTGVDEALGPLLEDVRGTGTGTLVVLTSDHGEALGEHGEETHGIFAYEGTLHVPLVLWSPGLVSPGIDSGLARHVDIVPTILEAASTPLPDGLPGRSLLHREGPAAGETSYFEALTATLTRGWAPLRGEMDGRFKYIDLPIPELYDLSQDRVEQKNLFEREPDKARSLARLLPENDSPSPHEEPAENVARLRSLGYLSGSSPHKGPYGPADDPKTLIDLERDIQKAVDLYRQGKLKDALALARTLVARRPAMALGYEYVSFLEGQSGQARPGDRHARAGATARTPRSAAVLPARPAVRRARSVPRGARLARAVSRRAPRRIPGTRWESSWRRRDVFPRLWPPSRAPSRPTRRTPSRTRTSA